MCLLVLLTGVDWPFAYAARRPGDFAELSVRVTNSGSAGSRAAPAGAGVHGNDQRAARGRSGRQRPASGRANAAQLLPAATHHIYRPGMTADSCNASTFPAGGGCVTHTIFRCCIVKPRTV